ncbi:MAG: EF-P 5-aminopentanol modification-associated protein YfmF [Bacillota bacterium]
MTVNKELPIHRIPTKTFKTIRIQLRFFEPLDEATVSARALMLSMLQAKTGDYPSRRIFQNHLESLYDTQLFTKATKLGNTHVGEIGVRFIHPDYAGEDDYLEDVLKALKSALLNPDFDDALLREEKRFLKAHFASEYANKDVYATKRYQEHLFRDHPYRVSANGTPEGVDPVALENVHEAYKRLLENPAFITVVGDVDPSLADTIKAAFSFARPGLPESMLVRHGMRSKESVHETLNLSQDRLFMTLKSDVYYPDNDVYAMRVLDTLLGGGSDSLLFDTIRETHGLAYQVHSNYQPFTGLITIMAGVAHSNVEKAKDLVRDTLSTLQQGAFTDDALSIAKQSLKQAIKRSFDLQGALATKALLHEAFGTPMGKDEVLSMLDAVRKDDVVRVANTLEFIFTYVLGGKRDAET